jgi:hypothetical protein
MTGAFRLGSVPGSVTCLNQIRNRALENYALPSQSAYDTCRREEPSGMPCGFADYPAVVPARGSAPRSAILVAV